MRILNNKTGRCKLLRYTYAVLLVAVSCTNETTEDNSLSPNSVQIVLSVPQNTTRATVNPIGDESYIKDVRVLFFKESSNNVWQLPKSL